MTAKPSKLYGAFALSIAVAALFTLLIGFLGRYLGRFVLPPDQGPWWYYWQLAEPTILTRLSAWIPYILHQASVWALFFLLAKEKRPEGNGLGLSRLNIAALLCNLGFMALHLVQTQLFFDGLAQDVPVWSSQWSVIIMLVLILYMLAPRRGLILGFKQSWDARVRAFVRKWHGLYISWAIVYTFWFHPMVGDYGLLSGFFYMFLLFIQFSFARTKIHSALGWIVVLEMMVGLHGPAIAIQKMLDSFEGNGAFEPSSWIMFMTGFLFMFAFTGQYGLKLPKWARALVFILYGGLVVGLYAWRGLGKVYEISFIPVALYGGAIALAAAGRLLSMAIPAKPKSGA